MLEIRICIKMHLGGFFLVFVGNNVKDALQLRCKSNVQRKNTEQKKKKKC